MAAPLEATQRAELLIKLGMTQKQRDQSCLCLCVIWFFAGVEYAIILPTLWLYLQDLGMAKHWYLGLVLSVFSIANVCASPIFGSIADRGYIKEVLILASFFMILGNLFYFVADDGLVVLEARFLTGFGAGAASVAFAYLARVTTLAERTKVIGTTVATRQLGLLIGPALNFGTEHLHARLSHLITITPLNIPGLLMTGFWLIAALVTVFMFKDIPPALASAEDEEEEASSDSKASLVLPRQAAGSEPSLVLDEPDETAPLISIQQSAPQLGRRAPPKSIWAEYTQLPVLAIFVISFLCIFNQLALETWVTPFTNKYFGWRETANSIMYMIIGFVAIMGFLIVRRMAHQGASDRALMLIGLILEAIGLALALGCLPLMKPHTTLTLACFSTTVFFIVAGLPFLFIPPPSLQSKLTDERTQGVGQGLRRTIVSVGTIVGPLWAGAVANNQFLFLGLMLGLVLLASVIFGAVYRQLLPAKPLGA